MSDIKFIDTVKNQVAARVKQIDDKKEALYINTQKLKVKNAEIEETSSAYACSFEEKEFSKLRELKKEKEQLVYIIDVLEDQIGLMKIPAVKLDNEDVKAQVNNYIVEELKVKEALEEIDNFRLAYLQKIDNYLEITNQLKSTRSDIDSISEYMTSETKATIYETLRPYSNVITRYINSGGGYKWDLFNVPGTQEKGLELQTQTHTIFGGMK